MITRKPKYPHVIKDLDKIIKRLLTEEISIADIAAEYEVPYHAIYRYVDGKATITQRRTISKRGLEVAGRKRRGVANNPTGGKKKNSKAVQFGETYADLLSPVKHRIKRTCGSRYKRVTFEVQTKGKDGNWWTIDKPTCEDAAVLLLGRLYCYNLISQADYNEQECV